MIEGLKPYAEYKESGQEWLGGVPAHWDLKPGHAAFAKRKEPNRFATFRLCVLPMQPVTPPVIVANAHSGLRAVLGYREVARLTLLNNPEPLLWTKCALLISSFHLISTFLIRSPMLQFVGAVFDIPAAQCKDGLR